MKRYSLSYYILCFFLVAGAFAAMAQNDYGIKVLGWVAVAFAVLFVIQFVQVLFSEMNEKVIPLLELGSLTIMATVLALRAYYIRFPFVEVIFGASGLALITIYIIKLLRSWSELTKRNKVLAILVSLFYGSIIFYVVSMVAVPLAPGIAEPMGGIAFGLVILFCILSFVKKNLLLDGEYVFAFKYVLKFKDRSVVLLTLFVLFTAYMGLTKVGILPKMYSDEYPQAYFELVKQAETGNEKPVSGKYKHEEFKEMYDQFVSRNMVSDKK